MEWQPIETAPKDGTLIFVWMNYTTNRHAAMDSNIRKAEWIQELAEWRVENYGGNVAPMPSHWMPLPEPPQ